MPRVAIALGSNLGDCRAHLLAAVEILQRHLREVRVSAFLETEPEGVAEPQPPYLNAVLVGETASAPGDVLELLLGIERQQGRERHGFRSARTLDLDLILYDDLVLFSEGLTLPHPRFRTRQFVLEPLAEVAPDWVDPITGRTIGDLSRLL